MRSTHLTRGRDGPLLPIAAGLMLVGSWGLSTNERAGAVRAGTLSSHPVVSLTASVASLGVDGGRVVLTERTRGARSCRVVVSPSNALLVAPKSAGCRHGLYRLAVEIRPNLTALTERIRFTALALNGRHRQSASVVVPESDADLATDAPGANGGLGAPWPGETTNNWAGYVWPSPVPVTAVAATWKVPALDCSTGTSTVSTWVGVDGVEPADGNLLQAGSESQCQGSTQANGLWWEWYPVDPVGIPLVAVRAGDVVRVELLRTGNDAWYWAVDDETTGQSYEARSPVHFVGLGATAEWIVEDPPPAAGTLVPGAFPAFTPVTFSNMGVDAGGPWPSQGTGAYEIVQSGEVLAVPTSPNAGEMTVTYVGGES
jgi:Peptidase A4 family